MVAAVSGFKSDGLFAGGDTAIPIPDGEISAAKKVVSCSVVRRVTDSRAQRHDSVIDSPGCQQGWTGIVGCGSTSHSTHTQYDVFRPAHS
jgi:hypothetical protein